MQIALFLIGFTVFYSLPAMAADAWQRVPLSPQDRITLEEVGSQLQIVDAQGNDVAYGICPAVEAVPLEQQSVDLTPLIRGSELALRSDGTATVHTAPGVSLRPPWERWIADLRGPRQRVTGLDLPAGIDPRNITLRSSPDLQQWSRPLDFTVNDAGSLVLSDHLGADWLAIIFTKEPDFAPAQLVVSLAAGAPIRGRQWFPVQLGPQSVTSAPLNEAVRGVRVTGETSSLQAINIASRIKPSDAWKARGRWQPGDGATQILFNGIGDHQWQLQAQPRLDNLHWWLAHDRMEIRVLGTPPQPLTARVENTPRRLLACDAPVWKLRPQAAELTLDSLGGTGVAESQNRNILPWFLGLLALGGILLYFQSRR